MSIRLVIGLPAALLTALLAAPLAAQTPTGQTQLSLTASTYHDSKYFSETGLPGAPLATALSAADVIGPPDSSYGSMMFAKASGEVTATTIKLRSWARAYAFAQTGYAGAGALAEANAYASVPFRMLDAARTGQQGTLVVPLLLNGDVVLDPGFYDITNGASAEGRAYMLLWASGLGAVNCGSNVANQCLDISSNYQGTRIIGNGASANLTLHLPFIFGDWTSFSMQLWTRVSVSVSAGPGGGFLDHHGESDYSHTLRWGGVDAVLDRKGQALAGGWTIESVPGVNLAIAAVPEPGTWAMWAAGLLALGAVGLSRRCGRQR
jgi:hypothetical protein